MSKYTAIYAGLRSTKTEYDTLTQQTGKKPSDQINVEFGPCSNTRTFHGLTSAPGDSFWGFHGEAYKNNEATSDAEQIAGAAVISAIANLELKKQGTDAQNRFYGYVGASAVVASLFPTGRTYDCQTYPFSTSILCTGGGNGVNIAASRTIHPMPEVNVLLSDTLSHAPMLCNTGREKAAPQLFVLGGRVGKAAAGKTSDLPFYIERTGNLTAAASVDYATQRGTGKANEAVEGQDYRLASGRVNFLPGEERKTVIVTALGNNGTDGTSKRVYLKIANPAGAAAAGATTGTGNITNDDPNQK